MSGPSNTEGEQNTTRRRLLAGLGTGFGLATAGCLTTLPSFGQRVRYGEVEEPSPDGATYRRWLPADQGARAFYHVPGERGEETLGGPIDDTSMSSRMEYVGVDMDDVAYACRISTHREDDVFVLRTDPDLTHIEGVLDDLAYEPVDRYRGVDRYERPSDQNVTVGSNQASVGIGDDVVLYTEETVAQLEPIIDAGVDVSYRVHSQRQELKTFFEAIGGQPAMDVTYTDIGELEDSMARGSARQYVFDDDAAYFIRTVLNAEGEDISRSEQESWIESREYATDARRVDLRIDEPLVTIAVEFDHDRFLEQFGPAIDIPLVTWDVTYHRDSEAVEVVHLAGESVDAEGLAVRGDNLGNELPQFDDQYQTVSPGDSLAIDVSGHEDWHVGIAVVDPVSGVEQPLFFREDIEL